MTQKQIGGYEFNYEVNRIRNSSANIGAALLKIVENNPGPQTLYALVAKMAVENSTITNALTNIEKIGAQDKKRKTT